MQNETKFKTKSMTVDSAKLNCLIVLSGVKRGNSITSFINSYEVLKNDFEIIVATPKGSLPEFNVDFRFSNHYRTIKDELCKNIVSFSNIDAEKIAAMVIPHCPGAISDLANDTNLATILNHFAKNLKPICAVGMGVAGLFPAFEEGNIWTFRRFTMTTMSVFELAADSDLAELPIIPEDVIKNRGALYSCSNFDNLEDVHVVVDRHLITGQNEKSTITAVQNLIIHRQNSQKKS